MDEVVVSGVGIHPFGRFAYGAAAMGAQAAREALDDAGIGIEDVDFVLVGNVGGPMASAQAVVGEIGRTGVPVLRVEAACGSSGGALHLARKLVGSGACRSVLCVGTEKTPKGFIANAGFEEWQTASGLGVPPLYFALWAQQLLSETDATVEDLAAVAVKNRRHGMHNPNAMFRSEVSMEAVLASRMVCPPLTLFELCAPNEGAAAAVVQRRDDVESGLHVVLRAASLVSRSEGQWFPPSPAGPSAEQAGDSPTAHAARIADQEAGMGPGAMDFFECQDTDVASELHAYRELGLCSAGDEARLLRSGDTALGGRCPVNPSGGLLSKGEPLGASGLGQVHELVMQLRGTAGARQVLGARVGATHVLGAGYTSSVVIAERV